MLLKSVCLSLGLRLAVVAGLLLLAACASRQPRAPLEVEQLRQRIAARIPAGVDDRSGWAADIQTAFHAQGIAGNDENICATLAVIEQESGYKADPVVADLGRLARGELERRARAKRVPRLALSAALNLASLDGRSYGQRLEAVRTEGQLSELYEEIISRLPLGARLLEHLLVLLCGRGLQGFGRHQLAQAGRRTYVHLCQSGDRRTGTCGQKKCAAR